MRVRGDLEGISRRRCEWVRRVPRGTWSAASPLSAVCGSDCPRRRRLTDKQRRPFVYRSRRGHRSDTDSRRRRRPPSSRQATCHPLENTPRDPLEIPSRSPRDPPSRSPRDHLEITPRDHPLSPQLLANCCACIRCARAAAPRAMASSGRAIRSGVRPKWRVASVATAAVRALPPRRSIASRSECLT